MIIFCKSTELLPIEELNNSIQNSIVEYFNNGKNKVAAVARKLNVERNALRNYLENAKTDKVTSKTSRNSISIKMKEKIEDSFFNEFQKTKADIFRKYELQRQEMVCKFYLISLLTITFLCLCLFS